MIPVSIPIASPCRLEVWLQVNRRGAVSNHRGVPPLSVETRSQINTPGTVPEVEVGTTLIIDDGSTEYEPNPDVYIDQAPVVRVGQTLEDVEGIMTYSYSEYR